MINRKKPLPELKRLFLFPGFSKDDDGYGGEDEDDAEKEAEGEGFAEDEDAYQHRRCGFKCTEDGRRGGSKVFGGIDHHHQSHYGWNDGKPRYPEPGTRGGRKHQRLAAEQSKDHHPQGTVEQYKEIDFEGRHS